MLDNASLAATTSVTPAKQSRRSYLAHIINEQSAGKGELRPTADSRWSGVLSERVVYFHTRT